MKKLGLIIAAIMPLCAAAATPPAATAPFTGTDYSGVYTCRGEDHHDGKYKGTLTLKMDRMQSTGPYGAYSLTLKVPDYGTYTGEAVSLNKTLALRFALSKSSDDHGLGIATVKTDHRGVVSFRKYYYEPDYKKGNWGMEECSKDK